MYWLSLCVKLPSASIIALLPAGCLLIMPCQHDHASHNPQAMAAYRTAARLFPGLAAPLAGLGTEYARLNNMPLAEHMFAAATR